MQNDVTIKNTSLHFGRYVGKGLAHVIKEDPLTLRLYNLPNGRKEDSESYYSRPKNNVCAVCGLTESMRRKNIVPHEYRKYFPGNYETIFLPGIM